MPPDSAPRVPADTPRLFAAAVAPTALIEPLVSPVFAKGGRAAVGRLKAFHKARFERGIYWKGEG